MRYGRIAVALTVTGLLSLKRARETSGIEQSAAISFTSIQYASFGNSLTELQKSLLW
jgi:hypothetical protein